MSFEQQLYDLDASIENLEVNDEALDIYGIHGAVCAAVISPDTISPEVLAEIITGDPDSAAPLIPLAARLKQLLEKAMLSEEVPGLPETDDEDLEIAVQNWCVGFVETMLASQVDWLESEDEQVAEALLPILAVSGLIDDPDLIRLKTDRNSLPEIADSLSEIVLDLYLHFHAEARH